MNLFLGLFTILSMTAVSLTSCSNDDDNEVGSSDLIGTWYMCEEDEWEKVETWVTFKNDGTFNVKETTYDKEEKTSETYSYKGTYKVDGNVLTISMGGESASGKFSVKGDKLYMEVENDGETETEVYTRK